ncbi:unnamed protein product [Caenorhabditis bovis]|uniref:G-protein coupled receptors family 1 profile domain-containing protein n=1 Tax=Caenorhabditis bovis TaxID=2654633 RepID=A0A8S1F463_9PELO|nr:unnamed protein product [Caenorhabditis bovis]
MDNLVPIGMIYSTLILSIIGFIGNLTIVIITILNKSLKTRCNILVGLLAFWDAVVCIYLIQLRIMMLLNFYMINSMFCYTLSAYGLFALNMQSSLGLVIGCDRLYNVSFPLKYSRVPNIFYTFAIAICVFFSFLITFLGYLSASEKVKVAVCLPPTAYNGQSRYIWIASNFVISIIVIGLYGTSHIKCKALMKNHKHNHTIRMIQKLMRSLNVVIGIYVSTWFLTISALVITQMFELPPGVIAEINQQLGWLVIINASLNVFVYFWRTSEYRRSIIKLYSFGIIKLEKSSIAPISQIHRSSIIR